MLKRIVVYVIIIILILVLSYFLATQFGFLFALFFSDAEGGSFIPKQAGQFIAGSVPSLLFFTGLLFMLFGRKEKYIVALIIFSLIFVRAYYTGLLEITGLLFPLVSGLIGIGIGLGILKIVKSPHVWKKETIQDKI